MSALVAAKHAGVLIVPRRQNRLELASHGRVGAADQPVVAKKRVYLFNQLRPHGLEGRGAPPDRRASDGIADLQSAVCGTRRADRASQPYRTTFPAYWARSCRWRDTHSRLSVYEHFVIAAASTSAPPPLRPYGVDELARSSLMLWLKQLRVHGPELRVRSKRQEGFIICVDHAVGRAHAVASKTPWRAVNRAPRR
jgi:hypothetical protein